jgi:hypothetical protein
MGYDPDYDSDLTPKVGVYQNGRRIDGHEPPDATRRGNDPVMVAMSDGKKRHIFDYTVIVGNESTMGSVEAATSEEAIAKIMQKQPGGAVQDLSERHSLNYSLTVRLADGAVTVVEMVLPAPTPR